MKDIKLKEWETNGGEVIQKVRRQIYGEVEIIATISR